MKSAKTTPHTSRSPSAPRPQFEALRRRMTRLMLGEESVLERLLGCLLVNGALLLEGRPGVGEHRLAKRLAEAIGGRFASISTTPDFVPADLAAALDVI